MQKFKHTHYPTVTVFVMCLFILLALSASVLFARLIAYGDAGSIHEISLTEDLSEKTEKTSEQTLSKETSAAQPDGSFFVTDPEQTWTTDTDINLFSVHYDQNGNGVYTVESEKGDKVLAPGTDGTYSFSLHNTKKAALSYTLSFDSFFENKEGLTLPIEFRVSDNDGNWIAGSDTDWLNTEEFDKITQNGTLSSGRVRVYNLEWRWPYERTDGDGLTANDAYDTSLGNLAENEDLTLHVAIHTNASYAEDQSEHGGDLPTGDLFNIWIVLILLLTALIFVCIWRHTREKRTEEK